LELAANRKSLPITNLLADVRSLSAEEAEDLLGIYRQTLARIRRAIETVMQTSYSITPIRPNESSATLL
jgi:hypothetical protein